MNNAGGMSRESDDVLLENVAVTSVYKCQVQVTGKRSCKRYF